MLRIIFSAISFVIFILEFVIQLGFVLIDLLQNIFLSFIFAFTRYHNRIQLFTTKTNYIKIEEVEI